MRPPGRKPPWATPDPPASATRADAWLALQAVEATGLDDTRRAPSRPGVLWAEGWEPPALSARAALRQVTQACATCAACDPCEPDGARAVLAHAWPMAPALRAVVSLRVASYDELHEDSAAYHLRSLADVATWAGELLERAQQAEGEGAWEAASRAAGWAGSLAGQRYAHPLRAELGHVADALCPVARDFSFGAGLVPAEDAPPGEQAALASATARLATLGAALLVRAFALELPAAAALIAGAPRADGLRLVPGPSRAAAALVVGADPWLMPLVVGPELREALDRLEVAASRVAGTYRAHPDPGGHAYGPPDAAFDGPGMDGLEAVVAEVAELASAPSELTGFTPALDRALEDALRCARGLRAGRGWGYWDEQATALGAVGRLCVRLVSARAIAKRDA